MADRLISWSKKLRESARSQGKFLVVYGYDRSSLPGKRGGIVASGPCDERSAELIVIFASKVHHGMAPQQALDEATKAVSEFHEWKAEKALERETRDATT